MCRATAALRPRLRRPDRAARRAGVPAVPAPRLDRPRPADGDLVRARRRRGARRRRPGRAPSTPRSPSCARPTPIGVALAVRFECSIGGATLCPGELAWSADDGRTVLIHLPQLAAAPLPAGAPWPAEAPFARRQRGRARGGGRLDVGLGVDRRPPRRAGRRGADRRGGRAAAAPRARRRLCAWDARGLDRVAAGDARARRAPAASTWTSCTACSRSAADEPPQSWPAGPGPAVPPSVTTDFEEGATMHLGARPAAREPVLDLRLPRPTRLVSRSGALHAGRAGDWHSIPRYDSLAAALAAVAAAWQALRRPAAPPLSPRSSSSRTARPTPPRRRSGPRRRRTPPCGGTSLTIQAAERERPTVLVDPGPWRCRPRAAPTSR